MADPQTAAVSFRHFSFSGDLMTAVVTNRHGGVSAGPYQSLNLGDHVGDDPASVRANRDLVAGALGVEALTIADQQHRARVGVVDAVLAGRGHASDADAKAAFPATDSLITAEPGVALGVMVADCAPVVLFDPVRRAVGVAHCGRNGIVHGVLPAAIEAMVANFSTAPSDLRVGIGPCIGVESYEIAEAEIAALEAVFLSSDVLRPTRPGHAAFDLVAALRIQLSSCGVDPAQVEHTPIDTRQSTAEYFSDRAERPCGRFMAIVVIR